MKYGLIGEKLSHSYSKIIHEYIIEDQAYELVELSDEQLDDFFAKKEFLGINVTIPYKSVVMKYLNFVSEEAKIIGSVNTIINDKGILKGYNTDCSGFKFLVDKSKINVKNKKVLLLGTGGTSKTVKYVLNNLGVKQIIEISRNTTGFNSYNDIKQIDYDLIVNTTPVGMYPNIHDCPLPKKLITCPVIDVIYNPLKTSICLYAKDKGFKNINGLPMLVYQASEAIRLFHGIELSNEEVDELINNLYYDTLNLILIGMPGTGKSVISKELAKILNRTNVDIDKEIEKEAKMKIPLIFETYGENHFRDLESSMIAHISKETGLVVAGGGGIIKRKINVFNFKHNGILIYLNRPVRIIKTPANRPLVSDSNDMYRLYEERHPYYLKYADVDVKLKNWENDINLILKELEKYDINY